MSINSERSGDALTVSTVNGSIVINGPAYAGVLLSFEVAIDLAVKLMAAAIVDGEH